MSTTMLTKLNDQYRAALQLVDTVTEQAARRESGLSDQDRETIRSAQADAERLKGDIELLAERVELSEVTADRLRATNTAPELEGIRSRGELVQLKLRAANGDRDAEYRYGRFMRAAQHMGTLPGATVPTGGHMAGLLVAQNVGAVIDVNPAGRPLLTALGVTRSADPMAFRRPRIEDPDFLTGVGVQAKEKAELASKAFNVTSQDVSLVTLGGYLNISAQLQAMPIGALDLAISQLERRLAYQEELAAVAALNTGADVTETLAATAGGADFLGAVFRASANVYAATGQLASVIAMGPDGWARVGSFTDAADRPLFPSTTAVNAMGALSADTFQGSAIAGLRPVVTPAITGGDFYVLNPLGLEAYEYPFPLFQSPEPSVLGTQVAVAAAFGTYRPVPGGVARIAPAAG